MSDLGARHPFVVFADDYGRHPSSTQHLFAHVRRDHPLIWVNTVGVRRPRFSPSDLRRAFGIMARWAGPSSAPSAPTESPMGPVRVLSPMMSPFSPTGIWRAFNRGRIASAVRAGLEEERLPASVVISTLPLTADLIGELGECLHVYYCVDDYTEWPGGYGPQLLAMERTLLERVDGVISTSRKLYEERVPASGRREYLPHGVDRERFVEARDGLEPHPSLSSIERPRAGYVGLLDERHDLRLWRALVERLPDIQFVLVGPRRIERDFLGGLANVHWVDAVPYLEVPAILAGLDVAVLPYELAGAGRSINPLKAKEIVAAGLPLVATPVPELATFGNLVRTCADVDEFAAALREALAEDRGALRDRADAFLVGESWAEKSDRFVAVLESWLREKEGDRGIA